MYKKIIAAALILLIAAAVCFLFFKNSFFTSRFFSVVHSQAPQETLVFHDFQAAYDMKLGKITIGRASLVFSPEAELKGRKVSLVVFETRSVRITDTEKIYGEEKSFLPLRVERDIHMWPLREKIIEEYDQEKFVLTITKFASGREESVTIKKEGPIQNAILLPFFVRGVRELVPGWKTSITLPTQEYEIRLVCVEKVVTAAGIFEAYRFESSPKKFEFWLSADERRIPLKISGTGGKLGYTLLLRRLAP